MADMTNGSGPEAALSRGSIGVEGADGRVILPASRVAPPAAAPQGGVKAGAGLAVQLMGAAMSLALLIGGGVWGYKLIVRDATGVPVVRAMSGPMREAPADPGGEVALHTGLSVNAVAAMGEAAPPEDVLVLAPPTPDLTDEDLQVMPMAEAEEFHPDRADLGLNAAASDPAPQPAPEEVVPVQPPANDGPMSADDVLALADAIAAEAAPLEALSETPLGAATEPAATADGAAAEETTQSASPEGAQEAPQDMAAPDLEAAAAVIASAVEAAVADQTPDAGTQDADTQIAEAGAEPAADPEPDTPPESPPETTARMDGDGRLLRSLRPPSRPTALNASAVTAGTPASAAVPQTPQTASVSTQEVPSGTTLVQLGAFDSPELAAAEWGRLEARFAEFMTGKDRLIQQATSGGRAFYRLRAIGFEDINDARRFCSTLVAEDAPCIPVVVR